MKLTCCIICLLISAGCLAQQAVSLSHPSPALIRPVEKDHYKNSLGFFCKKELQLEQKLKMPIKLRIGSIEQCNYLEQKPGYKLPDH